MRKAFDSYLQSLALTTKFLSKASDEDFKNMMGGTLEVKNVENIFSGVAERKISK